MDPKGSSCRYFVSRAVEEPIDATFELGEEIKHISGSLERLVTLGTLGLAVFILLLIPSFYQMFYIIIKGLLGDLGLSTKELVMSIFSGLMLLILIAIIVTLMLYLIHVRKFNSHLLSRYSLISELKDAGVGAEPKSKTKGKRDEGENGGGKYRKNPIFAMIDLVEESMHELPQMVKLIKFCRSFIIVIMVFLSLMAVVELTVDENLIFVLDMWGLVFGLISIVLFVPTLLLLMESERFFKCVKARHDIIDNIRFERDIDVPAGNDPLERLCFYLKKNDPFIRSTGREFEEGVKLKGLSGEEYRFDARLVGDNRLKKWSGNLGIPPGKIAVFIKVFKKDITKRDLRILSGSVLDIYEREKAFPLRVLALQWEVQELADDVYDHVLENPITIKKMETPIQVVAEDGDVYSFIPMVSYGKETD